MAEKKRYVGPNGAVFVVAPGSIDDRTIAARLESGEWTEYQEKKAAAKKAAAPKSDEN